MMSRLMIAALLAAMIVATCTSANPVSSISQVAKGPARNFDSSNTSFDIDAGHSTGNDDDGSNNVDEDDVFPYEPMTKVVRPLHRSSASADDNKLRQPLNLERESSVVHSSVSDERPAVSTSLAAETDSPNADRFGSIAFNSREVRLVGPNKREVEMKDDVPSKVLVALENLQKEAGDVWDQVNEKLDKGWKDIKRSEVWGQVNDKLDKGWTDLKTMVEGVVSPSSKRQP